MSRRTKAKKSKQPKPSDTVPATEGDGGGSRIQLQNPMRDHFKSFIIGNATMCQRVIRPLMYEGQHIVVCGAGPSLADEIEKYAPDADHVWGCNSAATWLYDNGHKVTAGFTVDQQPQMVEEWHSAPPIDYILASSVHPHLTDYLHSKGRKTWFFHNYVGLNERAVELCDCGHSQAAHSDGACKQCECGEYIPRVMKFEDWLYALLYEATIRAGSGLNTATRAIDVAYFATGPKGKITLLGADCALRVKRKCPTKVKFGTPAHRKWLEEDTVMHADGGSAIASNATHVTLGADIDGRWWESKPDLIISAIWLVNMARVLPNLEIVGDTLPNALLEKPPEYLARLPHLADADGRRLKMEEVLAETYANMGIEMATLMKVSPGVTPEE